jgi:hypothetical protein
MIICYLRHALENENWKLFDFGPSIKQRYVFAYSAGEFPINEFRAYNLDATMGSPKNELVIDTTDGGLDEEDLRRIMYAIIDLFNDAHEPNVLFARFYLRCNGEFELDSDNRKNLEDRFQDRIGFCNFRYVDQHLPSTEFPGFVLPHPTLKWTLSMEVHSGAYFKIKEDQKEAFM